MGCGAPPAGGPGARRLRVGLGCGAHRISLRCLCGLVWNGLCGVDLGCGAHGLAQPILLTALLPLPASLEMNESSRWTEEEMETAKKGKKPLSFFLAWC